MAPQNRNPGARLQAIKKSSLKVGTDPVNKGGPKFSLDNGRAVPLPVNGNDEY